MVYSADLALYQPGDTETVELVADASGNVPAASRGVEIVGETAEHTQVALQSTAGSDFGQLADLPEAYDENKTYAAGERVGLATVFAHKPVRMYDVAEGATLTAGNLVVLDAGGVVTNYDDSDPGTGGAGHTPDMIRGDVYSTRSLEFEHGGKVGVALRI